MSIIKEISTVEWANLQLNALEARIAEIYDYSNGDTTENGSWYNFGDGDHPFVKVKEHCIGDVLSIGADKSSFIVKVPCTVFVSATVYVSEGGGSTKSPNVHIRLLENGGEEAHGSKAHWAIHTSTVRVATMNVSGIITTVKPNEYFNIQYNVEADSQVDFYSTASPFADPCAVELFARVVGLPAFTEKNEQIFWNVVP